MTHVYIEGKPRVVDPRDAAKRVIAEEWYVCTADHNGLAEVTDDPVTVIYHRNPHAPRRQQRPTE